MERSQFHKINIRPTGVSENSPVCWVSESVQKNLRDLKVSLVRGVEVKAHIAVMDCHKSGYLHAERKTSLCLLCFHLFPETEPISRYTSYLYLLD